MARRAGCWRSRILGAAIQAIHADPARVWTVEALAEVAGVSRPRWPCIKRKAGIAPLEYVLRWRMQLAARALTGSQATISPVAQKLGYDLTARSAMPSSVSWAARRAYRRPPVPPDGQQGR